LDITNSASIEAAAAEVTKRYGKLDILINNAGVSSKAPSLVENLEQCISVNLLGSARVTESFLPLLKKSSSSRLIFITSVLGSIAARSDPLNPFAGIPASGYRTSKAALNMLLACYTHELAGQGIKVFGICPEFLATELNGPPDMMRQMGAKEPETGAQLVLSVVEGKRDHDQGQVVFADGTRPW
jgi:NAD(P)-dependent dehydrogenase (short-subunit alcohol dehydrogenase family)